MPKNDACRQGGTSRQSIAPGSYRPAPAVGGRSRSAAAFEVTRSSALRGLALGSGRAGAAGGAGRWARQVCAPAYRGATRARSASVRIPAGDAWRAQFRGRRHILAGLQDQALAYFHEGDTITSLPYANSQDQDSRSADSPAPASRSCPAAPVRVVFSRKGCRPPRRDVVA